MRVLAILMAAIGVLAEAGAARAGEGTPWIGRPNIAFRLIAARLDIDGAVQPWAAIEARIEPGWRIYWRSPGDSGLPTVFDWSASRNLGEATLRWPAPSRSRSWGLDTIGYGERVVFPVALRWRDNARPSRLDVLVSYGICREICIPDEVRLALDVSPDPKGGPGAATLIRNALATVPATPRPEIARVVAAARHGTTLAVDVETETPLIAPDLFVDGAGLARAGTPEVTVDGTGRRLRFEVPIAGLAERPEPLTLTLVGGPRPFEWRVPLPFP